MKTLAVVMVLSLMVPAFAAPDAPAQDAPAPPAGERARSDPPWSTFRGDGARTGNTSDSGPETNNLLWSNSTGSYSYSSPAIADGKVYLPADDRYVYCFHAGNGTRIWRTLLSSPAWSGPAVDVARDRVFVCDGTGLANSQSRNIYSLNATTGAQVWKKALPDFGESSPLICGDTVIVGAGDSFVGGKNNNLYCFNFTNGDLVWAVPSAGSCASPALYEGRLYSVGNGQLRCLDPATGAFFWNASVSHGYGSPSLAGGLVFYSGENGRIYAFNASTGSSAWSTASGYPESYCTPAVSNGSVYVTAGSSGGGGALVKLDAATGAVAWTQQVAGIPWTSPAVSGERVFLAHGTTVVCINATDHSTVWSYLAPAGTSPYGIGSSPSIAAGKLYIGASEAKLYCFGQGAPNQPPAAVALERPANINETAMTLNWSRSADADFARYELHMSKSQGFQPGPATLVSPAGNISDVNRLSLRVDRLEHTTRYYFKVRVWDAGAPPMRNDSNEVDGTTLTPNGAPWAVKLHPAEDITPYSVRLSWSESNDTDFDRYEVHRSLLKTFTPTPASLAATVRAVDGNSTTVSGLKPWTTYYIKVRVYDNGTPVLYSDSNLIEVLTGNTAPAAVVLNQPQMGATSADLSWSASADDDFAAYEVHLSENGSFTPGNATLRAALQNRLSTDFSVDGLRLARTYRFVVRVVDQGGMFNDSNEVSGLTANTVPKAVITSPQEDDVFDTRTPVDFDASASSDQDLDPLSFHWVSSVDGFLSQNATFTRLLSEGIHRISLFVNDGSGHNVSARLSITVNKAPNRRPEVAVAAPPDNSQVFGVVTFSGTASDIDGNDTLRTVEVKIAKGDWQEADGTGGWSFEWNTTKVQNGKYRILFRSFDGDLYSPEAGLSVTVNNVFINRKPEVAVNPLASSRLSRSAVITGTASDPDGAVSYVEVSVDGGVWQRAFGTRDWTFTLDTTELRNGKHSLRVRAYDGTDHSEEALVDFTVSNAAAGNASGPPLLLVGGLLAAVLAAAAAAFFLMRRRKGPEPQSQVVSGDVAAAQQGYIPLEQAAPAAQPLPAYSAFYRQQAGYSGPAPQTGADAAAPPPMEAEPVPDEGPKQS